MMGHIKFFVKFLNSKFAQNDNFLISLFHKGKKHKMPANILF
jgi:hypothetical protein